MHVTIRVGFFSISRCCQTHTFKTFFFLLKKEQSGRGEAVFLPIVLIGGAVEVKGFMLPSSATLLGNRVNYSANPPSDCLSVKWR